jgi:hypothetical protein
MPTLLLTLAKMMSAPVVVNLSSKSCVSRHSLTNLHSNQQCKQKDTYCHNVSS